MAPTLGFEHGPHWWEESAFIMYHSSLAYEQAPHLEDIVESRRARGTREEKRKKKKEGGERKERTILQKEIFSFRSNMNCFKSFSEIE